MARTPRDTYYEDESGGDSPLSTILLVGGGLVLAYMWYMGYFNTSISAGTGGVTKVAPPLTTSMAPIRGVISQGPVHTGIPASLVS